jgi:hypothetical protein
MTKARLWQFNALCSLMLLISTMGIFWSWRSVLGLGHKEQELLGVPLVKKIEIEKNKELTTAEDVHEEVNTSTTESVIVISDEEIIVEEKKTIPAKINLDVPFTSQAPEKSWDQPWQDACEEAAVLMLAAYYRDFGLSPLFAKEEMQKMVDWEEELGWGTSIEIEKVGKLVKEFVTKKFRIVENPTVEQMKQYIQCVCVSIIATIMYGCATSYSPRKLNSRILQ